MDNDMPFSSYDKEYLNQLLRVINNKYPGLPKSKLATIFGIGKTSFSNLFNKGIGSQTLNTIVQHLDVLPYDDFAKLKSQRNLFLNRLLANGGEWVSYCLSSNRKLYVSKWIFRKVENEKDQEKIEVVRDSVNLRYDGELTLNFDMTINIHIQTNPKWRMEYFSTIPEDKPTEFYGSFNYLVFECTAIRRKEVFSSLEILFKGENLDITPSLLSNARIPTYLDSSTSSIPTNSAYLAYNYLTRHVSKARRTLDNYEINKNDKSDACLNYKHDMFISCPISFIRNENQFMRLRKIVGNIIDTLVEHYGFNSESIYCEVAKYEHYSELRRDDRELYFSTRQFLRATHFISIVPEELNGHSSSIYMEIYFRILKKLPALVFIENRLDLPSLLKGVIENNERPVNITFKDIKSENIATYMADAKEYLLEFSL